MTDTRLLYLTCWLVAGMCAATAWYAYGWQAALIVAMGVAVTFLAGAVEISQ